MPTLEMIPTKTHTPIISLRISGESYLFLVDTGASHTLLNPSVIKKLPYTVTATGNAKTINSQSQIYKIDQGFKFITAKLQEVVVAKMDLSIFENLTLSGIIGRDILSQFESVEFNFKKHRIIFK